MHAAFNMGENTKFIVTKWRDKYYRGCFSGVTTLWRLLNADFDLNLTKQEVIDALKTVPSFVNRINHKKIRRFRSYNIEDAFDTWQVDLAFMPKYKKYIGFIIIIDIGSRRIYTRTITNKKTSTINRCLEEVIKNECSHFSPQKIISDAGKEFEGLKAFFKKYQIFHKIMRTAVKASLAERHIGIIKQRLYKGMDTLQSKDWPSLLGNVVTAINSTEKPATGGVKPIDIKTPFDNDKLQANEKRRNFQHTHWYDQMINQKSMNKTEQIYKWVI